MTLTMISTSVQEGDVVLLKGRNYVVTGVAERVIYVAENHGYRGHWTHWAVVRATGEFSPERMMP